MRWLRSAQLVGAATARGDRLRLCQGAFYRSYPSQMNERSSPVTLDSELRWPIRRAVEPIVCVEQVSNYVVTEELVIASKVWP